MKLAANWGRAIAIIGALILALLMGADGAPAGAALHVVNSTGDQADANVGDTLCDVDLVAPGLQCTIRAAFQELVSGTEVHFNIPGCPPACTISPNGVLPSLANNNVIDGTTQPGYSGTPLVTIDGTNITNGPGINLGNARFTAIRGLVVENVDDDPGVSGGAVDYLEVSDSRFTGNAGAGVSVHPPIDPPNAQMELVVTNSEFTDNLSYGVIGASSGLPFLNATITGNTFSGNGSDGIELFVTGSLNFSDNVASNNGEHGAYIVGGSGNGIDNANINGNVLEGNALTGITSGASGYVGFSGNEVRNNGHDGANLTDRTNEVLEATGNVVEDNERYGLRASVTGTSTLSNNTMARNGLDGVYIGYEQYVGAGVPPAAALTVTGNTFTDHTTGAGVNANDFFQNFSVNASSNVFSGNGFGLATTALSLNASNNVFDTHAVYGLVSAKANASGLIRENTFTSNAEGLLVNGAGVGVHFNRFAGNQAGAVNSGGGTLAAENNWWGCNEGPNKLLLPCETAAGSFDFDPWLVLNASAVPGAILTGQTSAISGDVTVNSDGQDTSASGHLPDDTTVSFGSDLGNFGGIPLTQVTTLGGKAGATMTADEGPGVAHVTVALDSAAVEIEVVISQGATATPTATPSPTASGGPTQSAGPTPTTTAGATGSPTQSAAATPTPTSGSGDLTQGDVDCSGVSNPIDTLKLLRYDAGLSVQQGPNCPEIGGPLVATAGGLLWGDVDCDGNAGPVDGLKVLRFDAGLSVQQEADCPDIGQSWP